MHNSGSHNLTLMCWAETYSETITHETYTHSYLKFHVDKKTSTKHCFYWWKRHIGLKWQRILMFWIKKINKFRNTLTWDLSALKCCLHLYSRIQLLYISTVLDSFIRTTLYKKYLWSYFACVTIACPDWMFVCSAWVSLFDFKL